MLPCAQVLSHAAMCAGSFPCCHVRRFIPMLSCCPSLLLSFPHAGGAGPAGTGSAGPDHACYAEQELQNIGGRCGEETHEEQAHVSKQNRDGYIKDEQYCADRMQFHGIDHSRFHSFLLHVSCSLLFLCCVRPFIRKLIFAKVMQGLWGKQGFIALSFSFSGCSCSLCPQYDRAGVQKNGLRGAGDAGDAGTRG